MCPSDALQPRSEESPNSYRFNVGSSNPLGSDIGPLAGAFLPTKPNRPEYFRDGLSQTAGLSERLVGSQDGQHFDRARDFWGAGVLGLFQVRDDNEVLSVCRTFVGNPGEYLTNLGQTWMMGGNYYVWYNHVAPPNDRSPDCATGDLNTQEARHCEFCSVGARSAHSGGVNCLMMDGAVRFIRNGVDLRVWRASGPGRVEKRYRMTGRRTRSRPRRAGRPSYLMEWKRGSS